MQINFLKKIVENVAGIPAVRIVDLLYGKKDINEFLIAKKLDLTINQTRNLLYKLSHLGILSSIRKKDKRKGWYIYFWTFNVLKSLEVLSENLNNEINGLKSQLSSKQQKRFYRCKLCSREVNEESALVNNFTCVECGEVYELADNVQNIGDLVKQIAKLEKELQSIKAEIVIEQEKVDQKITKNMKKEEKIKKDLRDKNRALKARKNKKLLKATGKKKQKKISKKTGKK